MQGRYNTGVAGIYFVHAEAFADGAGNIGAKRLSTVRDEAPMELVYLTLVNEDVGGARGGELGSCCGVHVGEADEAVGEEKDVGVAALGQTQTVMPGPLSRGSERVSRQTYWAKSCTHGIGGSGGSTSGWRFPC